MTRDNRMAIDEEHNETTIPNKVAPPAPPSSSSLDQQAQPGMPEYHPLKKDKGKKKATAEEVQQHDEARERDQTERARQEIVAESIPPEVLAIARRIHEQDRVGDLEDHLRQAHESLARALDRNRQLEQELEKASRGTKQPHTSQSEDSAEGYSSKHSRPPVAGPSRPQEHAHTSQSEDSAEGHLSRRLRLPVAGPSRT